VTEGSARHGKTIGPRGIQRLARIDRDGVRAGARRSIRILAVAPLEQLQRRPPRLHVPHDHADHDQEREELPRVPAPFQTLALAFRSAMRDRTKRRTSAAGGFFVKGKRIVPFPETS